MKKSRNTIRITSTLMVKDGAGECEGPMKRFEFVPGPPQPDCGTSKTVFGAIGEVVNSFEQLDDQISTAISFLLRRGEHIGRIVTAELAFRAKVKLLNVLFAHERPQSKSLPELRQLSAACLQAEERRNQFIHSTWCPVPEGAGMKRIKHTARGKQGLRTSAEVLAPDQVDALWQHCAYLDWSLDELMFGEFGSQYGEP
jgi:hypothetical protein